LRRLFRRNAIHRRSKGFLSVLREIGSVSAAAKQLGLNRSTCSNWAIDADMAPQKPRPCCLLPSMVHGFGSCCFFMVNPGVYDMTLRIFGAMKEHACREGLQLRHRDPVSHIASVTAAINSIKASCMVKERREGIRFLNSFEAVVQLSRAPPGGSRQG
jgi:hypothetical protein